MVKSCHKDKVGKIKQTFLCKIDLKVIDLQICNFLFLKNRPQGAYSAKLWLKGTQTGADQVTSPTDAKGSCISIYIFSPIPIW